MRLSTNPGHSAHQRQVHRGLTLSLWLVMVFSWPVGSSAQSDRSLTAEFARMSPKERAQVARHEQEAAAVDTAYQAIMAHAEDLFTRGRYDEALSAFEQARERRPLNVYPKVKIEDVQVLIRSERAKAAEASRQDTIQPAEAPPVASDPPPVTAETPSVAGDPAANMQEGALSPATNELRPAVGASQQKRAQPPAVIRPKADHNATRESEPLPDGITENRYVQGTAEVTELFVTETGKTTVFKRVVHKWGQTYYFEDGQAVDGRVWRQRFGDRP